MRLSPLFAALSLSLFAGTALAQNEPQQPDQPVHTQKAKPAPHPKHKAIPKHKKAAKPHKTLHPEKAEHKPADPDTKPHD